MGKRNGNPFPHSPNRGATDVWLTPKAITDALGPFDLDPCSLRNRPWDTAKKHLTECGLSAPWTGFVWCNPPFSEVWGWLDRMSIHNNGIALCFARTETKGFFKTVWCAADAILFLKGRPYFCRPDGKPAKGNSGAPIVLVAYGKEAIRRLQYCGLPGKFIDLSVMPTRPASDAAKAKESEVKENG